MTQDESKLFIRQNWRKMNGSDIRKAISEHFKSFKGSPCIKLPNKYDSILEEINAPLFSGLTK